MQVNLFIRVILLAMTSALSEMIIHVIIISLYTKASLVIDYDWQEHGALNEKSIILSQPKRSRNWTSAR